MGDKGMGAVLKVEENGSSKHRTRPSTGSRDCSMGRYFLTYIDKKNTGLQEAYSYQYCQDASKQVGST